MDRSRARSVAAGAQRRISSEIARCAGGARDLTRDRRLPFEIARRRSRLTDLE
jgi:hypothetical protein